MDCSCLGGKQNGNIGGEQWSNQGCNFEEEMLGLDVACKGDRGGKGRYMVLGLSSKGTGGVTSQAGKGERGEERGEGLAGGGKDSGFHTLGCRQLPDATDSLS